MARRPGRPSVTSSQRQGREPAPWIALVLAAALLIPFLGKAVTIDDPLFVWTARHLQQHPFDPYGFEWNWFGSPLSMAVNVQNPPATSYWLALMGAVSWNEHWLHLMMLPWSILLLGGVVRLARSLGADPFWAATLTLGTSAYFVSATNMMCDLMMLALMVWSIALWVNGLEKNNFLLLIIAAALGGLAALTKYFAISIVPLLAAYTVVKVAANDRIAHRFYSLLPLVVTLGIIGVWHFWSRSLYGASHIGGAANYAKDVNLLKVNFAQLYSAVTFLGGCLIWPLVIGVQRAKLQGRIVMSIAAAGGPVGLCLVLRQSHRTEVLSLNPYLYVIAAIFFAAGVAAIYLSCCYHREHWREPNSWLLSLWVYGTIMFMSVFNWTVAARNVLPLVPPLALLVSMPRQTSPSTGHRSEGARVRTSGQVLLATASMIGLAAAVLAASADYDWADMVRRGAVGIATKYINEGRTVFFQGHWGFQYYMMEHGGVPSICNKPNSREMAFWWFPSTTQTSICKRSQGGACWRM